MPDAHPTIVDLHRYPVKGLSSQPSERFAVTAAAGLADDRRFALALGTTVFDPENPRPLEKGFFLMLRRNEALAALSTRYDGEAGTLSVSAPGHGASLDASSGAPVGDLVADLGTPDGRAAVERFFNSYVGEASGGGIRIVEAAGHKFTDVSHLSPAMMKAVSVVNLASVRDLARRTGLAIDPLRFRANIHLEGLPAWAEMDWLDDGVAIGSARFRCVRLTQRCGAIDVDPATGARDMNLTKALVSLYGHPYCGVYLEVVADGAFDVGAAVVRFP